ncbi:MULTISPECIES: DUF3043 domain-containing protein [unclassified Microbacterium]|uniref:DUF3043 domain-containing protein n=1 Tax=unclassified Microbacterium TaxID=2609290 RepID=UPI00214AB647|nr:MULTISPECIES: DUF3043 domain-containing protein [unclassified Microbacterium]MCR2785861.1 DUF3043 domain-containing protein [Microbacterium sp. zg.B96]MDL5350022.1 DUF3043 domain-containing protein [Microbacterium sp. zg-YB36]WIM17162.1 DUF3043 domain-containing protein [Microbacterium sp. zg-B96]
MAHTPAPAPKDASTETSTEQVGQRKGRPTPSRSEREAARKRPLVADTKEARARAKAELATAREKARIGMANGDERYLPARDKGPQRKFARDFVDAGWHLGEIVMPMMLFVIILTFVPIPAITYWSFVGLWIFILFVIGDMILTSIRVKQAAKVRFGDRREKGLGWYAAMRTIQMRFMRLPKAQVKRGTKIA